MNNEWLDEEIQSLANGFALSSGTFWSIDDVVGSQARERFKQAILSKLESLQVEAYKKGYIQCGLDELRKYENDKG